MQRRHSSALHFFASVHILCSVDNCNHVRPDALINFLLSFHLHSLLVCSYIIGIYDLETVQGGFNIFKETQFAQSAIAFPVVSIVAGVALFVVGQFASDVALPVRN
jgi:hypothetical protein